MVKTRYMILLAQSLEQKWQLGDQTVDNTPKWEHAPSDDQNWDMDWEDEIEKK